MSRFTMFMRGASVSALVAVAAITAGPAAAEGKADRARTAIGTAQAKVDTASKLNADGDRAAQVAHAQAVLATAKENLARGAKEEAIRDAIQASQIADTAIGGSQRDQKEAAAAQAADSAAQQQAATVQAQAAVADANQRAADADQRAQHAQQAAAAASAQAAARQPTVTTTTVERTSSSHPRKVVRVVRPAGTTTAEKTTTTVSAR